MLIVICFGVVIMTDARINPQSSPGWPIWHWGNHDWHKRHNRARLAWVIYCVDYVLYCIWHLWPLFPILICIFPWIKTFWILNPESIYHWIPGILSVLLRFYIPLTFAFKLPWIGTPLQQLCICIIFRGMPGFANGCLCGVWYRWLTTYKYNGPPFDKSILNSWTINFI